MSSKAGLRCITCSSKVADEIVIEVVEDGGGWHVQARPSGGALVGGGVVAVDDVLDVLEGGIPTEDGHALSLAQAAEDAVVVGTPFAELQEQVENAVVAVADRPTASVKWLSDRQRVSKSPGKDLLQACRLLAEDEGWLSLVVDGGTIWSVESDLKTQLEEALPDV